MTLSFTVVSGILFVSIITLCHATFGGEQIHVPEIYQKWNHEEPEYHHIQEHHHHEKHTDHHGHFGGFGNDQGGFGHRGYNQLDEGVSETKGYYKLAAVAAGDGQTGLQDDGDLGHKLSFKGLSSWSPFSKEQSHYGDEHKEK